VKVKNPAAPAVKREAEEDFAPTTAGATRIRLRLMFRYAAMLPIAARKQTSRDFC
jgi:hypothetical protein